ncbi:NAD(P)-dependent oxidoreductase [Novosphingobium resinovorum]|uniref:6-phosphogluconate dehydrogenase n=1 Tax=Novosphingobium resinovorum TaxID=158500 RepID=A0A1D7ZZU2_9SPHN|nr:NAD(P)-dependent oxidoreductase [Novosphingobium resinovorum]AOR75385.1 6-phosphogluconate dehydrogenase [Novosphingobium resinovorum]
MAEVGFIGLGSQGAPIAMRMMTGNALTVWARRPEALATFAEKGAKVAASVADLGTACDHIGVCVVNDADVVQVCDLLLPAMRPGSVLAIHSTILPQTCEALAAQAAKRGVLLLDAPVSGGSPAAEAGRLTVMCGGSEEAFARALPVLRTFGAKIVLLGPAGAGQRAKIVNNALLAAHMGLAHSALAIAEGLGVDRAALADLIQASSGRSFGFEVYARLPAPPAFAHGGSLLFKDVSLLGAITHPGNPLALAAMPFLDAAGVTGETP